MIGARIIGLLEIAITLYFSITSLKYLRKNIRDSFNLRVHNSIMELTFEVLNDAAQTQYKMKPYVHYYPSYEVPITIYIIVQSIKNHA